MLAGLSTVFIVPVHVTFPDLLYRNLTGKLFPGTVMWWVKLSAAKLLCVGILLWALEASQCKSWHLYM